MARLTEMEQNFSALTARMCKIETGVASASNVSGSARSWPSLEQIDGCTAAGSHGSGSSDDNRNTRRRLDTFSNPDDENARSAVLLQFPCEQCHAGVPTWLKKFHATANMPTANVPVRIHFKTASTFARLVVSKRANCQEFCGNRQRRRSPLYSG